jgi:sugar lactone lactonase YvrE
MTQSESLVNRRAFLQAAAATCIGLIPTENRAEPSDGKRRRFLYVACPGIRNYLEFGGAGILVFDIDAGYRFVRRIATPASREPKPENIKGICASAVTGRLYFTTLTKLYCLDLRSDETLWSKALPGGCDRLAIRPDGKELYVPSLEKDHWNIVNAENGELISQVETRNGAHNTICSLDGRRVYLAGLRAPWLYVLDTASRKLLEPVGPFSSAIRPFTINGRQTRCYCCVNGLLGFEVGDLVSGKKLHRISVEGYQPGPVKRHGCPSHGVGLTPDEREVWVCDAANQAMHIFDNTGEKPVQVASVRLREQPGWITFSLDGCHAWPSTGEIIDVKTRKIITALRDEQGREVHSEKMVEIHFEQGKPVQVGDQFGLGRVR